MDKLKAIFRRKKQPSGTAGTKTEVSGTNGATPIEQPKPTATDTAAAPSTSEPTTAPAGAAAGVDAPSTDPTPAASEPGATPAPSDPPQAMGSAAGDAQKKEAASAAAP